MRRIAVFVFGLALLGALAAPAQAVKPTRFTETTAEAFWTTRQDLTATTYQLTTWSVGVFASTDGTSKFSDLYQDVELCTVDPNGDICNEVSSKFGGTDFSGLGDTFTMDFANLSTAHLEATYQVQAFDQNGNPVGSAETDHIVADWTGTGVITKSRERFSFHSRCIHFSAKTKGRMRPADATGTLNGTSLGTTSTTFFGGDASFQVDHFC
jgi:hypothetical protein